MGYDSPGCSPAPRPQRTQCGKRTIRKTASSDLEGRPCKLRRARRGRKSKRNFMRRYRRRQELQRSADHCITTRLPYLSTRDQLKVPRLQPAQIIFSHGTGSEVITSATPGESNKTCECYAKPAISARYINIAPASTYRNASTFTAAITTGRQRR